MGLSDLDLLRVNDAVLADALSLQPVELRTLDAIHLATARQLGAELSRPVTYDDGMTAAAEHLGMATAAPT